MQEQLRSDAHPTAAGRGRSPGARVGVAAALLALAATGATLAVADRAQAKQEGRPNVVVIMTDDQTVESMRVMDTVDATLAQPGVTFASSYASFPLCCPSRATLLTGQYGHNHGTMGNGPPEGGFEKFTADHGANTLPAWLQGAGYSTTLIGKYLNGYGAGGSDTFVPPGWSEWYAAVPEAQRVYDYTLNENGTLVPYGSAPSDFKQDVITQHAVDVINRRAPASQPFFVFASYTAPHGAANPSSNPPSDCGQSAQPAPRHADAFDSEPLPQPPSFDEADVSDKPPDIRGRDPITAAQRNQITRRYRCRLGSLLSVDEGVGRIVSALRSHRELDDTLIIYTADNGFFAGEHRVQSGKTRHYEPSSRVPLVVRGPGVPEGKTARELAVNPDLARTVVDAAGASPGLGLDGRSLLGLAADPKRERGREILIETRTYSALRNARFKYVEHHSGSSAGAVELYDLEQDPFELRSQHANPAFDALEAQLAARLDTLRDCAGTGCRTKPALKLKVRKHRGCAPRRARVRVKGADATGLGRVTFELAGKRVGKDSASPFKDRLGKLKRGRKSKLRAVAEMGDGRVVDLFKKVRGCR